MRKGSAHWAWSEFHAAGGHRGALVEALPVCGVEAPQDDGVRGAQVHFLKADGACGLEIPRRDALEHLQARLNRLVRVRWSLAEE